MTNFARSLYATTSSHVAMGVALVMFGATPAFAQDQVAITGASSAAAAQDPAAGAQPTTEATAGEGDEIVVTGFRASLQSAVNTKKRAEQIVESVSAEDIGKLPDASIAESIARLPGLTTQRLSGRANVIAIRGFGPDYSTTLLNGREQTTTGDNRAVEFDQYPSEVINQVNVYKTPMASIVGQGISGTVDLRTIRPLDFGKQVLSVGVRGVYTDLNGLNNEVGKYGYRVNGVYVDQFADDKIGVALAVAYNNEPYHLEEFEAWGYAGVDADTVVIGGAKPYQTSTELKRLGLSGTLQFKPIENWTSSIDGFYSNFKDDQIKRGIELPLAWGGAGLIAGDEEDGVITSGTFTNVQSVVRNVNFQRHAKLYSFGWNNRYDTDDGWHGVVDISWNKVDRNELIFETWAGTGFQSAGVGDTIGFESTRNGTTFTHELDYSDPNLILLTDMNGWGGDGYSNNRIVKDRIWQYRGEIAKDLNSSFISKVTVGANRTNHDKSLTPDEHFIRLAGGPGQSLVLPEEFRKDPVNLDYLGLGPMLTYDPLELLEAGIYELDSNNDNLDVQAKAYNVHEKLDTLYAQADIRGELGSAELTGNIGVQAVHTDQSTDGYTVTGGVLTPAQDGAKFWDVMPSLNLSARFPNDFVVRLGLAREVMRPRMDSMRLALNYGVQICNIDGVNCNFLQGSSGNPRLRPFRANAADLSFEKYFGIKGYVSAQFFYKKFNTFVVEANLPAQPFDFTGLPLPEPFQTTDPSDPATFVPAEGIANGFIFRPFNVKGGKMYGVELATTLPVGEFVKALDGFGITGGVSYTKSRIRIFEDADPSDLPGYSKWVMNGTAFFEKYGFNIRGSVRHRTSFIGEVSGFGANRVNRRARPETIIDGQIGYEFQPNSMLEGLSVYLQGQNLTDEPFVTQNPGAPLQVINYQRFGRRFMLGATYKF